MWALGVYERLAPKTNGYIGPWLWLHPWVEDNKPGIMSYHVGAMGWNPFGLDAFQSWCQDHWAQVPTHYHVRRHGQV